MKITLLTLLTISSSVLSALTVVPSKINYQGLITDTDGSPIVSTTNTITAHLYGTESGGTALYSESFVNVNSDSNGIYSIEIGDVGLQSVLEGNNELWLELIINQQTLSGVFQKKELKMLLFLVQLLTLVVILQCLVIF